jgi:DNA-directed RNA polymerase specialized sigma24 family protein
MKPDAVLGGGGTPAGPTDPQREQASLDAPVHSASNGVSLAVVSADRPFSPEQLLVAALQQDDREVLLTVCWQLWHRPLLRRALRRGLDLHAAEDALQDVFTLLARDLERVRGPRLQGWLSAMVDYECKRYHSQGRRLRAGVATVGLEAPVAERSGAPALERRLDQRRDLAWVLEFYLQLEPADACVLQHSLEAGACIAQLCERLHQRFGLELSAQAARQRRHELRRLLVGHIRQKRGEHPLGRRDE